MKHKSVLRFVDLAVAACIVFGGASYASYAQDNQTNAAGGKIGVNYSILTSPFWTAYDAISISIRKSSTRRSWLPSILNRTRQGKSPTFRT
jgi:hypothetical protein